MRIFRLFWTLVIVPMLLTLAACSQKAEEPDIVAKGQGKPALWKVSGKNGSAYLFGTVHLLPPGTDWETPIIDEAMQQSDSLITEVTGTDNKAAVSKIFTEMSFSPGLPPIENRIPPMLADNLEHIADETDLQPGSLDKIESWAAAVTIASAVSDNLGMKTFSGAEAILQAGFSDMGKPHSGLETVSQQFGYFDQLPEADQRILLTASLRSAGNARTETQKMLDNWMRGDVDALMENAQDGVLASPKLREVLLDNRNRNWADILAKMIDQGRAPFVAVGAAHMAGPSGLPALLKAKGYKVEQIQ
jgi:uncharacterized protein